MPWWLWAAIGLAIFANGLNAVAQVAVWLESRRRKQEDA